MERYGDWIVINDPPDALTGWLALLEDQQQRCFSELIRLGRLQPGKRFALGWSLEVLDEQEEPEMFSRKQNPVGI